MFLFTPKDSGLEIKIQVKRFDATDSERFNIMLAPHITDKNLAFVHIDVSEVEFIDSAGIKALVNIHKNVQDNAKAIKILHPQPAVVSMIELLRLTSIFKIEN